MAGEILIPIIGNLVSDLELRFTPSGSAVANMTIASTARNFDKNTNGWVDAETVFMRASIWREAAENAAESLQKGMRVIGYGKLKSRSYDNKEGQKITVLEMELDEIGPSLRYANAKVNRTQRNGQGGSVGAGSGAAYGQGGGQGQATQGQQGGGQQGGGYNTATQANMNRPAPDPWATPSNGNGGWAQPGNGGGFQGAEGEPPF